VISVLVPVYNEEDVLSKNKKYFAELSGQAEVIFIDGGSEDDTVRRALVFGEVISSRKGRSVQMNAGARLARHDILLFLHADTRIPLEVLDRIETAVTEQGCIGGCLKQIIDHPGLVFRWIAWTGNMRAKLFKVFYGDQGIFVRKDVFEKIGGFADVALCEDVFLSQRLKAEGKVGVLEEPIYCSARRWLNQGIGKTFLLNMKITAGVLWGGNLGRLAEMYKDIR
jgi:rSAM/selenodomain-associated transferase 2